MFILQQDKKKAKAEGKQFPMSLFLFFKGLVMSRFVFLPQRIRVSYWRRVRITVNKSGKGKHVDKVYILLCVRASEKDRHSDSAAHGHGVRERDRERRGNS